MSTASPEMQAYYAARVPYYDAVYLKPERRRDIEFLAGHLPSRFAAREVIEVACGTGYWTQHLAPRVARMVATDGTAEPLAFARLRPGSAGVTYRQADAYALPPDLGLFDGAFAGLWFSHVPLAARTPFLVGLHRHLRPRARVILIDNNDIQLRDFPITETDADGNTYQHRTLRDGSVHRVLKNFPGERALRDLVAPFADAVDYRGLENFWLLEYELR
ncbi:demethylmenaquinone methyltransferase/2-methoxy-6-polyprenyl-1,4-benzoquinol methylase [Plasticicumulans lactativorans]|uniref:Demethylmenaquinone methyltransferase/2-methoxy-6-polyprenyl-1,4-benzoquinol methylase n=1 Tax=Plasticicumulans lactativorans TaxID=1133106 RepID=A0A4V2SCU2_9GAMM|nr:class I SAM-dependent methyltransferase [Plasticicumulans lactativorans]TCO80610.1 demethylmenaquinone methyltransferase/2-methoxy-6-polyprenyl-1,4-benzoquinol methylase [Plasticicumulans lactativorans]